MKIEKETKTLAEAIEKDVQAVVNPATAGAMETTEQNKKIADDNMKEAEKASEELAKNEQPDAHQDVPSEVKANFKKLHLAESLDETTEAQTTSYKEYSRALSQLQRDLREEIGSRIEVLEMGLDIDDSVVELGVNWPAKGTVSADETDSFADKLKKAADAARNFKYAGYAITFGSNESLNENTIESSDEHFRTNDRTSELLDAVFSYMREIFGENKFTEMAIDHLGMDQKELKFYCDIDGDGYFESLNEADEEEYPHTFLGSKTHFRRKNLTDLNEIEIIYPSFTVKYNVEAGIQTKPGDPVESGFERDELARLEIVRDEQDKVENLFKDTVTKTLSDKGYKNVYIGGGALVGIPNAIHLLGDKVGESLTEAVKESTFSKLYGDLVQIPYVDRFVRTKFSKDEKQVDLTIILDDYIDMDAVYDVLDQYSDKIVVDEDDEELHIHIDMSDEERNTDIPSDLFDEIMTQLTAGGRLIPGKGKGYVSDYGAGYDEVSQIANADGDKGIVIRILPGHEADKKGHVSTFEPAKAIADKYKDLGVYTTERTEIEKTSPHRVTKVMTIWIPEGAKAAGRDERVVKKKKEESVESCKEEKPIEEAVVKTGLDSFKPWEGAIDTFDRIKRAGKLSELENLIDELYGGEINEDELNDTLWFEADWVLETLGIGYDD